MTAFVQSHCKKNISWGVGFSTPFLTACLERVGRLRAMYGRWFLTLKSKIICPQNGTVGLWGVCDLGLCQTLWYNSGPAEVMSTLLLLLTMGTGGAGVLCASPSDSRALSALASISIDIKRRFKGVRRRDERLGWAHSVEMEHWLKGQWVFGEEAHRFTSTILFSHHVIFRKSVWWSDRDWWPWGNVIKKLKVDGIIRLTFTLYISIKMKLHYTNLLFSSNINPDMEHFQAIILMMYQLIYADRCRPLFALIGQKRNQNQTFSVLCILLGT